MHLQVCPNPELQTLSQDPQSTYQDECKARQSLLLCVILYTPDGLERDLGVGIIISFNKDYKGIFVADLKCSISKIYGPLGKVPWPCSGETALGGAPRGIEAVILCPTGSSFTPQPSRFQG